MGYIIWEMKTNIEQNKNTNIFYNIKSKDILKQIFGYLQ